MTVAGVTNPEREATIIKIKKDEFHEIYRDVKEPSEAKHDNEWIITKWESKRTFPLWDDFLLNMMENEKLSADNYTPIQYLLLKQEASTTTADLPYSIRFL